MRGGPTSTNGSGYQRHFGELYNRSIFIAHRFLVQLYAIRALRGGRYGNGNELLLLDGERPFGEGGLIESPGRFHRVRRILVKALEFVQLFHIKNKSPPLYACGMHIYKVVSKIFRGKNAMCIDTSERLANLVGALALGIAERIRLAISEQTPLGGEHLQRWWLSATRQACRSASWCTYSG
nr:hypothetical protein [Halomonas nanhaiensis]